MIEEINQAIQRGRARDVKDLITKALEEGYTPKDILDNGLLSAMSVVGTKFKNNEIFVPEVLISARALNTATAVLKPYLIEAGVKPIGKAVICTVKGDLHDIGKNLVRMMLEGAGIEVVDLGVDVSPETIANAVKESGAKLVCLSALLTTTMNSQKDTIDYFVENGIRDTVKIMVGGAPVTAEYAKAIGADAYTADAASAAEVAKSFFA